MTVYWSRSCKRTLHVNRSPLIDHRPWIDRWVSLYNAISQERFAEFQMTICQGFRWSYDKAVSRPIRCHRQSDMLLCICLSDGYSFPGIKINCYHQYICDLILAQTEIFSIIFSVYSFLLLVNISKLIIFVWIFSVTFPHR